MSNYMQLQDSTEGEMADTGDSCQAGEMDSGEHPTLEGMNSGNNYWIPTGSLQDITTQRVIMDF